MEKICFSLMSFRLKGVLGGAALSTFLLYNTSFSQEASSASSETGRTNNPPAAAYSPSPTFLSIFDERLEVNMGRTLSKYIDNEIGYLLRREEPRKEEKSKKGGKLENEFNGELETYERMTKNVRSAVFKSLKQAGREYIIEEIGVGDWLENLVFTSRVKETKYVGDVLTDALSGREEKGLIPSPFHANEGYYEQIGFDPDLGWNCGWRPLREEPFVFLNYGTSKFETQMRLKVDNLYTEPNAELVTRFPIKKSGWMASGGIKAKLDEGEIDANMHLGLGKTYRDEKGREKSRLKFDFSLNHEGVGRATVSYRIKF